MRLPFALRSRLGRCFNADTEIGWKLNFWDSVAVVCITVVHTVDVGFDIAVCDTLKQSGQQLLLSIALLLLIVPAVLGGVSSYMTSSKGQAFEDDQYSWKVFVYGLLNLQIFTESYRCITSGRLTERLLYIKISESVAESTYQAALQAYTVFTSDVREIQTPLNATVTLYGSILFSLTSVGFGLAFFERGLIKLDQERFPRGLSLVSRYFLQLTAFRSLEIVSRMLFVAIFTVATDGWGLIPYLLFAFSTTLCFVGWEQRRTLKWEVRLAATALTFAFMVVHPFPFVHFRNLFGTTAFTNDQVPHRTYYYRLLPAHIVFLFVITMAISLSDARVFRILFEEHGGMCAACMIATVGMFALLPTVFKLAAAQQDLGGAVRASSASKHAQLPQSEPDDERLDTGELAVESGQVDTAPNYPTTPQRGVASDEIGEGVVKPGDVELQQVPSPLAPATATASPVDLRHVDVLAGIQPP